MVPSDELQVDDYLRPIVGQNAAVDSGLVVFECGHFATEEPGIRALAQALQNSMNTLKCNVGVYISEIPAYSFPQHP